MTKAVQTLYNPMGERTQCAAPCSKKSHSKTRFLSCWTPQEISKAVSKNLPYHKHESNSV